MAVRQLPGTAGSRFTDEPLFDSARVAASGSSAISAQQIDFFQTTFGQGTSAYFNSGAKTQTDTNLEGTGGVIPNKAAFVCKSIGFGVFFTTENATEAGRGFNATAAPIGDLSACLRATDLYYRSQVEEQFLGPPYGWPFGGGAFITGPNNLNANAAVVMHNGEPTQTAIRKLQKRLILPAGLSFRFSLYFRNTLTFATASLPILFVTYLRGYWIKPA